MEDKKRNRLKLKVKKPTFNSVSKRGENRLNKVKVNNAVTVGDNDDVIHITDDEDDMKECSRLMTTGTLDNLKLIKLQDRCRGFNFPMCDVWKLDDLPPYKPEEFNRIKKNYQNDGDFSYNAKLLNLPRLKQDYLTSKQTNYDVAILYDNTYSISDDTSPPSYPSFKAQSVASFSGLKRQRSEELDADSKRTNLNTEYISESRSFSASKSKSDFIGIKKDKPNFHSVYASTSIGTMAESRRSVEREIKSQLCPICAVEFSPSKNQLDIDSHIAVCLSVADDDVVW